MTKAKVYKDVVCLEMPSNDGAKWWYHGASLCYTPVLIHEIKRIQYGVISGTHKEVLAVPLRLGGQEHLVAINLPRTDIVGLMQARLWNPHFPVPHQTTNYTPWPDYTGGQKSVISLA